jgi:hypothetical protein
MVHLMGAGEVSDDFSETEDHVKRVHVRNMLESREFSSICATAAMFPKRRHIACLPRAMCSSVLDVTSGEFMDFQLSLDGVSHRSVKDFGIEWKWYARFAEIGTTMSAMVMKGKITPGIRRLWLLFFDHFSSLLTDEEIAKIGRQVTEIMADGGFDFGMSPLTAPRALGGLVEQLRGELEAEGAGVVPACCMGVRGPLVELEVLRGCESPTEVVSFLGGLGLSLSTSVREPAGRDKQGRVRRRNG